MGGFWRIGAIGRAGNHVPAQGVWSGAGLQLADRKMGGEHRRAGVARQAGVGFGSHLRAVAGLLQLGHRVAIGCPIGRVLLRLRKLRLELPDDGHQHWRRGIVSFYMTNCIGDPVHHLIERDHAKSLARSRRRISGTRA